MSDRQGVEIDYCPNCRGIWLDRGELDKILERASTMAPAPSVRPTQAAPQRRQPDFEDSDYGKSHHKNANYGYGRKKSWLSEIFD
jgi:uncharacterized protein